MSHESRGRALLVSAAVIFLTCLGAASDDASSSLACGSLSVPSQLDANPSKLDYLVLASMADSPRPLAMTSYSRAASLERNDAPSGTRTPVVFR